MDKVQKHNSFILREKACEVIIRMELAQNCVQLRALIVSLYRKLSYSRNLFYNHVHARLCVSILFPKEMTDFHKT
jgi:hypothetical protein